MFLLILAIILVSAIGYLAQTTGLCLVRGVGEAASGKPSFLLAILFSGTLGWVSLLMVHFFELNSPFVSSDINFWAMLGGLSFGAGAALNQGCGISTISKLARGQIIMAFTMLGWLVGWWLQDLISLEVTPSSHPLSIGLHSSVLLATSICLVFLASRFTREERWVWVAMLAIGLIAGVVFLIEPKWTPSGLLRDLSLSGLDQGSPNWPSTDRFLLFSALIGGMIVAAVFTRSFSLQIPTVTDVLRHLSAGVLMGIGAAIAGGGNDSQLLLALPSLSLAGLTTVLAILCGIYAVRLAKSRAAGFSRER